MAVSLEIHVHFPSKLQGKSGCANRDGLQKQVLHLLFTEEKAGGAKSAREKLAWGLLCPVPTHSRGHA